MSKRVILTSKSSSVIDAVKDSVMKLPCKSMFKWHALWKNGSVISVQKYLDVVKKSVSILWYIAKTSPMPAGIVLTGKP